jgi:hypothetical protein
VYEINLIFFDQFMHQLLSFIFSYSSERFVVYKTSFKCGLTAESTSGAQVEQHGNFRIWPLSILIFNWNLQFADFLISLLLLNYFLKIALSKLYPDLLNFFLKYNKIYGNFYLKFCPLIKHQLIFNA